MRKKPILVAMVAVLAAVLVIFGLAFARSPRAMLMKASQAASPGVGGDPNVFGEPYAQTTYLVGGGITPNPGFTYFGKFEYKTVGDVDEFCFDFKSNYTGDAIMGTLALVAGVLTDFSGDISSVEDIFILGFPQSKTMPNNKIWQGIEVLALDACCDNAELLNALDNFPPSVVLALVVLAPDSPTACSAIEASDITEVILTGTTLISYNPVLPVINGD